MAEVVQIESDLTRDEVQEQDKSVKFVRTSVIKSTASASSIPDDSPAPECAPPVVESEQNLRDVENYEQMFKDRYTENDADYMTVLNTEAMKPPIVQPWYGKPRRKFDYRGGSRGNYGQRGGRGGGGAWRDRGGGGGGPWRDHGGRDNSWRDNRGRDNRYQPYRHNQDRRY